MIISYFEKYLKAGTAVLASLECLPNPLALSKAFGTVNSLRSLTSSAVALPKAFQTNATRLFGIFNAHPLNQASLFRVLVLKKPLICMRGFVERTGFEPVLPP